MLGSLWESVEGGATSVRPFLLFSLANRQGGEEEEGGGEVGRSRV